MDERAEGRSTRNSTQLNSTLACLRNELCLLRPAKITAEGALNGAISADRLHGASRRANLVGVQYGNIIPK